MKDCSKATEKILNAATIEFMEKGYENANLRLIAQRAGVTTGAIYARYPTKDALFGALVYPAIEKFIRANDSGNDEGLDKIKQNKEAEMFDGTQEACDQILDIIYENKTAFSLLINAANGSSFENFAERIAENEEKVTWEAIRQMKANGFLREDVSKDVVHMLIGAHVHALFEIVRHDVPKEEARVQVNQINEFFDCGWKKIFGM